jgi:hypothetical protein
MPNIVIADGGYPIQQGIYEESATQKAELGRRLQFHDGRVFRYTLNGAGSIGKGKAAISPALVANNLDEVQTGYTLKVGQKNVEVKLTTAPASKTHYQDGFLLVNDGTGEGQIYKIKSHDTGDDPCKIELYDPIKTATEVTSEVSLIPNKYNGAIILNNNDGAPTGVPVGIPLIDITAAYYFWAQTKGYAPALVDTGDTIVRGNPVGKPHTHAVAGALGTVKNDGTDVVWGRVVWESAADEYALIDLCLE